MALAVFYALLQLLFLSGLGFFLSRLRGWPREIFHGFNRFVATVALPVSFFTSIARTDPASLRSAWIFPIAAVVVIGLGLALSAPVFGLLGFSRPDRRAGMGLSSFGNSGYLPLALMEILPLSLPALAERFGFPAATMYIGTYLMVNSPLLWTLGNWLVAGTGRPRLGELITPPFVGIVAGLAVVGFGLQGPLLDQAMPFFHVFRALERVGATTVPLIMIALGAMIGELAFAPGTRRGLFGLAAAVSAVRFVLLPAAFVALYLLVLKPLAFSDPQVWTIFLMMHLPPATNFSVMASRAGRNEAHVSFTLLATYVLYLFALPLYLLLFLRLTGG
jgi:predicted permease